MTFTTGEKTLLEKSNVLLNGPTGSGKYQETCLSLLQADDPMLYIQTGKTLLAKTLASILQVPLSHV